MIGSNMILGTIIYILDAAFDESTHDYPPIESIDKTMSFDGELTAYVHSGADLLVQNLAPHREPELLASIPRVVGNQFGGAKYKAIPATYHGTKFIYVVAFQ